MKKQGTARQTPLTPREPEPGRRESNRRDKLARITQAAAELFTEKGFDAATTREIARRAGVGFGTLFNFAHDKRDLIFLIYAPRLDKIVEESFASVEEGQPLVDQLVKGLGVFYREFAANPPLARMLLKELSFYDQGKLVAAHLRSRMRLIGYVKDMVIGAQRAGEVGAEHEAGEVALGIFFLFAGAQRWWIAADQPRVRDGLVELRAFLKPYIDGLQPHANDAARQRPLSGDSTSSDERYVFRRPGRI